MKTRRRHATLRDVALRAGCSTAVVSTVVNHAKGNTLVSPETRDRVLLAAKELDYRPNFASRSLVHRRTRTLGIYIPPRPWAGVGFSYEGAIIRGIESTTQARGYDLLLLNVAGQQDTGTCARTVAERRIDGLLLIHVEQGSPWLADLVKVSTNLVLVDYPGAEPEMDTIGFDNQAAGRLAVEHLVQLGHRRIGYVGSCCEVPSVDAAQRLEGYRAALAQHQLPMNERWIVDQRRAERAISAQEPVCQLEAGIAARHIQSLGSAGPTAWVAYGDLVAVHLIRLLQAAGRRIPQEISVMGVDDSDWCQMVTPTLTSIRHPLEEMGRAAAALLIDKAEGNLEPGGAAHGGATASATPKGRRLTFSPTLVQRQSTAPLPGAATSPAAPSHAAQLQGA